MTVAELDCATCAARFKNSEFAYEHMVETGHNTFNVRQPSPVTVREMVKPRAPQKRRKQR